VVRFFVCQNVSYHGCRWSHSEFLSRRFRNGSLYIDAAKHAGNVMLLDGMDSSQEELQKRRRELNRLSKRRCRQRRLERLETLQDVFDSLRADNDELRRELSILLTNPREQGRTGHNETAFQATGFEHVTVSDMVPRFDRPNRYPLTRVFF
jgi:hypothetical protein